MALTLMSADLSTLVVTTVLQRGTLASRTLMTAGYQLGCDSMATPALQQSSAASLKNLNTIFQNQQHLNGMF